MFVFDIGIQKLKS